MRILPKIASILLLFCASCDAQIYDFHAKFYDFVDENKFIFTDGENSITCKINGAEIINLNMKKECFRYQEDLDKYLQRHKKVLRKFMKIGKTYRIITKDSAIENGKKFYYCDIYHREKHNIRDQLFSYGWAVPVGVLAKDRAQIRRVENARANANGMFGVRFSELTNCLLFHKPMRSQRERPVAKDEFYEYYD